MCSRLGNRETKIVNITFWFKLTTKGVKVVRARNHTLRVILELSNKEALDQRIALTLSRRHVTCLLHEHWFRATLSAPLCAECLFFRGAKHQCAGLSLYRSRALKLHRLLDQDLPLELRSWCKFELIRESFLWLSRLTTSARKQRNHIFSITNTNKRKLQT